MKPVALLIFLLTAIVPVAASETPPPSVSEITQVVLLGVGNPNPLPDRSGPATAIVVNGEAYIIDTGPGVGRRAAEASEKYDMPGLWPGKIKHAFLTHLHWDHNAGFPDLLLTGWTMERNTPLTLVGPPGTKAFADNITRAFKQDIDIRVNGLEPTNDLGWRVNTTEGYEGIVYEDENVTVEAFRVCHGDWDYALGYKFTTPDRTIVISGDTGYCPIIAEKAKGSDILIHEVYGEKGYAKIPAEWQAYHAAFHTSSSELAKLANDAQPGLLILHHQLVWAGDEYDQPFHELRELYDGPMMDGRDLRRW